MHPHPRLSNSWKTIMFRDHTFFWLTLYFLPKNMPKNTYYIQNHTYWSKYLFLEGLPQKPWIMQNNYVSVCLLGMRSCNMADISRYSVLNLMRSSTDVIHNLLFVCHYFILWCQVLNICLCPLYPALHMTPVYEEEVHAPIFILAASLSPQRKSGLEYFISKVYGSLEQPCWLSGAEVLVLTMAMQCKSCELIEGYTIENLPQELDSWYQ